MWPVEADGTEMERSFIDRPLPERERSEAVTNTVRMWPVEDDGMEMERGIYDQPRPIFPQSN
jgi:hypothetical protein